MTVNWSQVDAAMAALPRCTDQVQAILAEHEQEVAKIRAVEAFTNDYKAQKIEKLKEAAIEKLQTLRASIGSQLDQVDRNRPERMGSDDPLFEMKAARAWARAEKMLDGGVPVHTVIRTAVEAQDAAMLLTLREEFPSRIVTQTQEMDSATRAATIEHFHKTLSLAVATGFPGTDEGRWLNAKLQTDLLSRMAHNRVQVALNTVAAGKNASTMEDAVGYSLMQRDLAQMQAQFAARVVGGSANV